MKQKGMLLVKLLRTAICPKKLVYNNANGKRNLQRIDDQIFISGN